MLLSIKARTDHHSYLLSSALDARYFPFSLKSRSRTLPLCPFKVVSNQACEKVSFDATTLRLALPRPSEVDTLDEK